MTESLAHHSTGLIDPDAVRHRRADAWTAATLGLLTILLFARTFTYGYVDYDDAIYAQEQRHVLTGVTWQNLTWSLRTFDGGNWHPLTWWSLMLDVEVYGPTPAGFHATNVLMHAASTVLVFWFLRRIGATRWPSAGAAAAFGWHALRAESVVWISERKDTLCVLLILLTLHVFLSYARTGSRKTYVLMLALLTSALASKAMAVSLPPIMLLLMYWPIGLRSRAQWLRAARDQILPTLIVIAFCAITIYAQKDQRAMARTSDMPMDLRIGNAVNGYVTYLRQTLVPVGLGFFYPHPRVWDAGRLDLAVTLPKWIGLTCVTGLLVLFRRSLPHVLIGWLFFGVTLVPVIGLVQVGNQAHADRYTYLPHVGLCIAAAVELSRRDGTVRRALGPTLRVISVLLLAWWTVMGYRQIGYWRDTTTLTQHTSSVVPGSYVATSILASSLMGTGRSDEALALARRAVSEVPNDCFAWTVLSTVYDDREMNDKALSAIRMAGLIDRQSVDMWKQYAKLLVKTEDKQTAIKAIKRAMAIREDDPTLMSSLALLYAEMGQYEQAFPLWDSAIDLRPDVGNFRFGRGLALVVTGQTREGIAEIRTAVKLDPINATAPMRLAWILATVGDAQYRDPPEAMRMIELSIERAEKQPPKKRAKFEIDRLDTHAAVSARNGDFTQAVVIARQAEALATSEGKSMLATRIGERARLYEQSKPFPPSDRINPTSAPFPTTSASAAGVSEGR